METPILPAEMALAPSDDALVALTVKEKWQGAVDHGSGFVAVPMALLRLQTKLGLSATDMIVLINLLGHWWAPTSVVYARSTTIAKRMGVGKRTVQRSTEKMLKAGLMVRDFQEDGRRVFRFDPLVEKVARDANLALQLKGEESLDA